MFIISLSLDAVEALPSCQLATDLGVVGTDATSIAGHLDLLARHGTTHVRASRGREQGGITELNDPLLPGLGRIFGGVDIFETLAIRKLDSILDPATLDLDGRRTVRKQSRSVWAVQVESMMGQCTAKDIFRSAWHLQVRISRDGGAQVRVGTILPFVLQVCSVDALQAHVGHAASHDVEASGERNDVVLTFDTVGCDDSLLSKFLDGVAVFGFGVDVDDFDVVAAEDFVVVLLKARSLDAECVRWLLWE